MSVRRRNRPLKDRSDDELFKIRADMDENPRQRAIAEAELSYRDRFWPRLIAVATIITAIVTAFTFFFKMLLPKDFVLPHVTPVNTAVTPGGEKTEKADDKAKHVKPNR